MPATVFGGTSAIHSFAWIQQDVSTHFCPCNSDNGLDRVLELKTQRTGSGQQFIASVAFAVRQRNAFGRNLFKKIVHFGSGDRHREIQINQVSIDLGNAETKAKEDTAFATIAKDARGQFVSYRLRSLEPQRSRPLHYIHEVFRSLRCIFAFQHLPEIILVAEYSVQSVISLILNGR